MCVPICLCSMRTHRLQSLQVISRVPTLTQSFKKENEPHNQMKNQMSFANGYQP